MRLTAWRLLAIASLLSSAAPAATRPHYGGTLRVQIKARVTALDPGEVAAALEKLGAMSQGDLLVLRSEQPAPNLLAALSGVGHSIWKRGADGALAGTGPFRLASWEPGKRAVFAANLDYWAGRPYLDAI